MAKITNLENNASEIIFPVTRSEAVITSDGETNIQELIDEKATITPVENDIGEGAELAEGEFVAVYGAAEQVQTNDIADGAVTDAKISGSVAFIDGDGSSTQESPWIEANMIKNNTITNEKIKDGEIEASKLDFSTICEVVGSGDNVCYKFANGLMIASIKKTATISTVEWGGGTYESEVILPPNFAAPFVSVPACTMSIYSTGLEGWLANGSGRTSASDTAAKTTRAQGAVFCRTSSASNFSVGIAWLAIGRWK